MGTIRLTGMEFFAYHGYHAEEQRIGNRYRVDVVLETDFATAATHDHLSGTVDYSQVFAIVQARMAVPARLLEHLAYQICEQLRERFSQLHALRVEVTKFNPPLGGVCEAATVSVQWPEKN